MIQLGQVDIAAFVSYPITTYKHVASKHVELDLRVKHEMAAVLHKLNLQGHRCQRLEDSVKHLEHRDGLLNSRKV